MASEKAYCPNCGRALSSYRTDCSEHKVHGTCAKCGERYTVVHGNGRVKVIKGYA